MFLFGYPNKTWVPVSISVYVNLTVPKVSALPHYSPKCTAGSRIDLNV